MWLRAGIPNKVKDLYNECKYISDENRSYVYGGGHGVPFEDFTKHGGLDCSSSTSVVLHKVGLFHQDEAWVSGVFASSWGKPGKGKYFTVWANSYHVWIQFHRIGRYWRFDTSPWGYGPSGPHMRITPRSTQHFWPRHYPGL